MYQWSSSSLDGDEDKSISSPLNEVNFWAVSIGHFRSHLSWELISFWSTNNQSQTPLIYLGISPKYQYLLILNYGVSDHQTSGVSQMNEKAYFFRAPLSKEAWYKSLWFDASPIHPRSIKLYNLIFSIQFFIIVSWNI